MDIQWDTLVAYLILILLAILLVNGICVLPIFLIVKIFGL